MLGLYWDSGKENGNYYLKFRVWSYVTSNEGRMKWKMRWAMKWNPRFRV